MRWIRHTPFGIDDPYINSKYFERRVPADPVDGEDVTINFKTRPMEAGQRAWLEVSRKDTCYKVRAQYQYTEGKWAFWTAKIESCKAFETISYRIAFGQGPKSAIFSDWYTFKVKKLIEGGFLKPDGRKDLFSFADPIASTDKNRAEIPRLLSSKFLTDGENVYDVELVFDKEEHENFYGLGGRFDTLEIRAGSPYFVYVFDQYKVQGKRTYAPIPLLFSNKGFGLFLDTGFRTIVHLTRDTLKLRVETLGTPISAQNFKVMIWDEEDIQSVIRKAYSITNPGLPPVWVFGPWVSANEWNSQEKIERVLERLITLDLPTTVLVIEAWSDEETFYIFNGAEYKPKGGDTFFKLKDFAFKSPWPNPKSMVDKLHSHGIHVILWQIPVLKYVEAPCEQHANDISYALKKGYVVTKSNGKPYTIPEDRWFGRSFVVDFFNPEAAEWWKKKRQYLISDLGIDGFKTDGGEHLWGRDTLVYLGKSASEVRNSYPDKYLEAAKELVGEDKILFSRSGYMHSPRFTLHWTGDEDSDFEAMKSNLIAGLNFSLSGQPFWGWDIAGFSGEIPDPELYRRAVQLAVFTPIFQFHSEASGNPVPSAERSPWNVSQCWKNSKILDEYRELVSLRMCLIPYIYKQAKQALSEAFPLIVPLQVLHSDLPKEPLAFMFGEAFLVIPVLEPKITSMKIFLPQGTWVNFWTGEYREGGLWMEISIAEDRIPVFARVGSVIPLSIPKDRDLLKPHWDYTMNAVLYLAPKDYYLEKHKVQNILKGFRDIMWFGIPTGDVSKDGKILKVKWFSVDDLKKLRFSKKLLR